MRLDLVRDAVAAARLPEVLAERCVHSLTEHASCRRCVDACPTGAWVIDDQRLGIDPARCDGCGLCAPACPQAAIVAGTAEPLRVGPSGTNGFIAPAEGTAMLACERAWPGRSGSPAATSPAGGPSGRHSAGVAPCVHSLGLRDLARLAAAGSTRLVVATGDCDACPRGAAVRLENRLADLARLLDSRRLPLLRLERLAAERWQATRDAAAPDAGPAVGRRSFLRRGLGLAVNQTASAFGLAAAERTGIDTVARLLPDTRQPEALAPVVPRIDPTACTGCDACVRLCPQQAIQLERGCAALVRSEDPMRDGSLDAAAGRWDLGTGSRTEADAAAEPAPLAYRVLPEGCTGCGICVDVCADRAVRLEAWPLAAPTTLPLAEAACARCRVRFHRPVIAAAAPPLCPICARRGGGTDRLFRLQE